jgi:hypothetical protein
MHCEPYMQMVFCGLPCKPPQEKALHTARDGSLLYNILVAEGSPLLPKVTRFECTVVTCTCCVAEVPLSCCATQYAVYQTCCIAATEPSSIPGSPQQRPQTYMQPARVHPVKYDAHTLEDAPHPECCCNIHATGVHNHTQSCSTLQVRDQLSHTVLHLHAAATGRQPATNAHDSD